MTEKSTPRRTSDMSTRAVYTFQDSTGLYHVYKHYDGYPQSALGFINDAKQLAWELPRFEADEFAASFIAVNKPHYGDLRLSHGPEYHPDIEYIYIVYMQDDELSVTVREVDATYDEAGVTQFTKDIYQGTVEDGIKLFN